MKKEYIPRIVDEELEFVLQIFGAVSVEGPKFCGKTTAALQLAKSHIYIDTSEAMKDAISVDPYLVLQGNTPRLIDEWQTSPVLWDAVRHEVDERSLPGQFILTGSTTPPKKTPEHSGAGRYGFIRMHTMSLYESGESTGVVSLEALFNGEAEKSCISKLGLEGTIHALVRGGWPQSLGLDSKAASYAARSYLRAIEEPELDDDDTPKWDKAKMGMFIRMLARNNATSAKMAVMVSDIEERAGGLSRTSAYTYLGILKNRFVIEEQPAWNAYLISKAAIRTTPKRHFTDPSLAAAALGATSKKLMQDFDTLGRLFESLCYRDCLIYTQRLGGSVFQYHDSNGLEVDLVCVLDDGRWGAIEVKLGATRIDEAAKSLLKLSSSVDQERLGKPSFLAILYSGDAGYIRDDGVQVIPIGCLGP